MKYRVVCIIVVGFGSFLLMLSPISAKDIQWVKEKFSSSLQDIGANEKDLGRGEPDNIKASIAKDIDVSDQDIDSKEGDIGQGEPLAKVAPGAKDQTTTQDAGFSGNDPTQLESRDNNVPEVLVGSAFTDAILEGSITEKPFLNSMALMNKPSDNFDEIGFIQEPEVFNRGLVNPEESFQGGEDSLVGATDSSNPQVEIGLIEPVDIFGTGGLSPTIIVTPGR